MDRFVDYACRVVLGGIFILAGSLKLMRDFAPQTDVPSPQTLYEQYLPEQLRAPFAALEVALGLWILCGVARRFSAATALVALVVFSVVVFRETLQPDPRLCGCTSVEVLPGSAEQVRSVLYRTLARDMALLAPGLWLLFRSAPHARSRNAPLDPKPLP